MEIISIKKADKVEDPKPKKEDLTNSRTEIKEESQEKNSHFFQGIGMIYGAIAAKEDGFVVRLENGQEFGLAIARRHRLIQEHIVDKPMNLRVYPQVRYTKGDRENYNLYFKLVSWEEGAKSPEAGQFILRGLWQFIPQYKRPVISVYRNEKRGEMDRCKSSHIPTIWKDSTVRPFKFNPKAKEQGDRYFCEFKAKFIPRLKAFGVDEAIEEPTKKIPRYIKPIRVAPGDANKPQAKKEKPLKKEKKNGN